MLEAYTPALEPINFVAPLPHRAIVSLSAFRGQTQALEQALGLELPATPRRADGPDFSLLWAGPNAWLAISDDRDLYAQLHAQAGKFAAITDQSDGRFLIRVSGPHARKILSKLVPIDLHPSAFAPDAVALTLAAHIGVILWREGEDFVLACFRSYAAALHHALAEAARHVLTRG